MLVPEESRVDYASLLLVKSAHSWVGNRERGVQGAILLMTT